MNKIKMISTLILGFALLGFSVQGFTQIRYNGYGEAYSEGDHANGYKQERAPAYDMTQQQYNDAQSYKYRDYYRNNSAPNYGAPSGYSTPNSGFYMNGVQ
jgi:hypothetical protein